MKLATAFGWIAMIAGVGLILSPMMSVMTGYAVATMASKAYDVQINFSLMKFAAGGILLLVGLVITKFDDKSILAKK